MEVVRSGDAARRVNRQLQAVVRAILWIRFVWLLPWLIGATIRICKDQMVTPYAPYALFNGSFGRVYVVVAGGLTLLWLAWTVLSIHEARSPDGAVFKFKVSLVLGVHLIIAWAFFAMGLNCLNALLDFSPLQDVPVYIHEVHTDSHADKSSGGYYLTKVATVNRLDHPNEEIGIDWTGCSLPRGAKRSPFATLRVGRGAFGVAWLGTPLCHPLKISEVPLFENFYVGRGQPAVLITVDGSAKPDRVVRLERQAEQSLSNLYTADGMTPLFQALVRAQDAVNRALPLTLEGEQLVKMLHPMVGATKPPRAQIDAAIQFYHHTLELRQVSYTLPLWLDAIERAAPGTPVVWIYYDMSPPAVLRDLKCSKCRAVEQGWMDGRIADRFFNREMQPDTAYLADGAGKQVFSAALSDVGRRDELAKQLAALRAK